MKNIIKITIFLQFISLQLFSQQGEWTWMNGNNFGNPPGVYGIKGVPDPNNTPPGLYEACEWTDLQGNLWLFGSFNVAGGLNALWKYNVYTNEWTWVKGDSVANQPGTYGTQGVPSAANNPGGRGHGVATWVDTSGYLWLFGGSGYDETGMGGELSDLWRYDTLTNEWTWMKGPKLCNQSAVYGSITVSDPTNNPDGRFETSCSWTVDNCLWLFGGFSMWPIIKRKNDLWRYDINSNEWTWMKGDSAPNSPGTYGTMGIPDPLNNPGARNMYSRWKDDDNNLWMFGGGDNGLAYNDMWKYNIATNNWTWMNGSSLTNQSGVYGTQCVPSVNNVPSARWENRACWQGDCDNFFTFGGSEWNGNDKNDLWSYNYITNEWTWVSGSNSFNQFSNYGAKTVSSPTNVPGSRHGAVSWKDNAGNLWIFGGGTSTIGLSNDLWRFVPDPDCPGLTVIVNNDTNLCIGASVTLTADGGMNYIWSTGDTDDSITVMPVIPATYTVTATMGLCSDTDEIKITVSLLPTADAGGDVSVCSGDDVALMASGAGAGGTYLWNNNITTASITVNPVATTTYTVIVTDVNGCTDDTSVVVNVNLLPTIVINGSNTICEGADTTLKATGGASYLWNTGETKDSIIVTPVIMTTYTVTGIDNNNCTGMDEIVITVNSLPEVDFGTDTCIGSGETIILDAGTGYTYLWQDNSTAQTYTVTEEGDYWIIATNNCGTDRDTIIITSCPASVLYIPNSFTPNGDNRNDRFMPIYVNITEFEMYVFSRWGQEIFHTTDINEGWEGKYEGRLCPEGVYTWLIYYKGIDNTEKQKKYGYVTLLK